MAGENSLALWPRSAPALPFGQSACGGDGLRSAAPQRASPAQTLTGSNNPAKVNTQGGCHPP